MSNTIQVNITAAGSETPSSPPSCSHRTDDSIRAEARRRILEEDAKARAEVEAARLRVKREQEVKESQILNERIRLMAEEEQVRIAARKLALEAEAKRLAEEKEEAIRAEMNRLKNRTQLEILEDKVTELSAVISNLRSERFLEIRSRLGDKNI